MRDFPFYRSLHCSPESNQRRSAPNTLLLHRLGPQVQGPGPAPSGAGPGARSPAAPEPAPGQPHLPPSGAQERRPTLTAARIQRRWQRLVARRSRVQGGWAPRECGGAASGARGPALRGGSGAARGGRNDRGARGRRNDPGARGAHGASGRIRDTGKRARGRSAGDRLPSRGSCRAGVRAWLREEPSSGRGGAAGGPVPGAAVTWCPLPRASGRRRVRRRPARVESGASGPAECAAFVSDAGGGLSTYGWGAGKDSLPGGNSSRGRPPRSHTRLPFPSAARLVPVFGPFQNHCINFYA